MEEVRVSVFRTLKPPCVELSRVALRYKDKKATSKDLIKSLDILYKTLQSVTKGPNTLDTKLADYIFFPLSHVFRETKDMPVRAVEIALQCLQILIDYGWRDDLSSDLGKQLLILLSFLVGGNGIDAKVKDLNEELGTIAFESLGSLFRASHGGFLGIASVKSEDVPILGHTVSIILDGIKEGPSVKVRLAALKTLDTFLDLLADHEALKNVFPGIVSSLTKVLSSKSGSSSPFNILKAGLDILTKLLCLVIGDDKVYGPASSQEENSIANGKKDEDTSSWATATAGQVKMALANILPLRYHGKPDVKVGLFDLCAAIISQCRKSLAQSIPMLTETLVVLGSHPSGNDDVSFTKLGSAFGDDTGLLEILKNSLRDWIISLPRVIQSNDDTKKERLIAQISTAFKVLQSKNLNLDVLNDLMVANLRTSITAAIQPSSEAIRPVPESGLEVAHLLKDRRLSSSTRTFDTILFSGSSHKATTSMLRDLAIQLQSQSSMTGMQQGITNTLRLSSGEEQLADLWLCLQLLKHNATQNSVVNQYLNLPQDSDDQQPLLDSVYSFSIDTLAKSTFSDEDRWELQCLCLEAVALMSQHQQHDFRPELVDALYPILERLGSSNAAVQKHAVTSLSLVSDACKYPDPAALVVDNADYLVNAIALKLNTFDISPQAPQVLVMMVKLSGAALIPYLDDLVDSIFSILACYHGYPKLVESLFSVLNAIVEEAAKASTPAIKSSTDTSHRPQPYKPTSITDLASLLRSHLESSKRPLSPPPDPPPSETSDSAPPTTPPRPPSPERTTLPKTSSLVHSIVSLTPAHLTTPSPPLRAGILNLLTSALPTLAIHTDSFLPIAATLWPAIVIRLYDTEPYVTLSALNALSILCTLAGDFLASRVEDEWPRLRKLYERVEREMREEVRVQGRRGGGMRWRVWDGMVRLVLGVVRGVVRGVGVEGEMEDGVFEMLGGWVGSSEDVREVLGELNADAVWLAEEKGRVGEGGDLG